MWIVPVCVALTVSGGLIIAYFGVWCFTKGQQVSYAKSRGEAPQQIQTPIQAVKDTIADKKREDEEKKHPSLETQIANLFKNDEQDEVN